MSPLPPAPECPDLPRLHYRVWDFRRKLLTVTALLVLESSIVPICLFYGLWYRTTLSHGAIVAIVTAFFGLYTIYDHSLRSWKLLFSPRRADYHPLGQTSRWHLDYTHFTLTFGYIIMAGLLTGACVPAEPVVRALAMPMPVFLVQLGAQLLYHGALDALRRPTPFRVSSVGRGQRCVPLVYTFVEDVVAVDGNGTRDFRAALRERYRASRRFRALLRRLNWLWGAGGVAVGVATLVVVWTVPQEVAYGVGWLAPLIFVGVWTWVTIHHARASVRRERLGWAAEWRGGQVEMM